MGRSRRKPIRRQRLAKRFSAGYINTGQDLNKEAIREAHIRVQRIPDDVRNRRDRTAERLEQMWNDTLIKLFGVEMYQFLGIYFEKQLDQDELVDEHFIDRRLLVERQIERLRKEGFEPHLHFKVFSNPTYLLLLFFNSTKTQWQFWEKDLLHNILRKSIKYSSKRRALQVYENRAITWIFAEKIKVEEQPLPALEMRKVLPD